jgi:hypothetical protein
VRGVGFIRGPGIQNPGRIADGYVSPPSPQKAHSLRVGGWVVVVVVVCGGGGGGVGGGGGGGGGGSLSLTLYIIFVTGFV